MVTVMKVLLQLPSRVISHCLHPIPEMTGSMLMSVVLTSQCLLTKPWFAPVLALMKVVFENVLKRSLTFSISITILLQVLVAEILLFNPSRVARLWNLTPKYNYWSSYNVQHGVDFLVWIVPVLIHLISFNDTIQWDMYMWRFWKFRIYVPLGNDLVVPCSTDFLTK